MKVTDMNGQYCLGIYNKRQCPQCRRNINLYEDEDIKLFWIETHRIRSSKAKVCPEYKVMDIVK